MKCDELIPHKADVTINVYGTIADAEVYLKEKADEAIAELKDKLLLDEDEMAGFLQLEEECGGGDLRNYIEELKARIADLEKLNHDLCERVTENDDIRLHWEEIEQTRAENEILKAKLESVQASACADSVDAGMRERRLQRALWIARAERASDKALIFYFARTESYNLNINGYSVKEKGHTRMLPAKWWRKTWLKVERKCLKKAEEYK